MPHNSLNETICVCGLGIESAGNCPDWLPFMGYFPHHQVDGNIVDWLVRTYSWFQSENRQNYSHVIVQFYRSGLFIALNYFLTLCGFNQSDWRLAYVMQGNKKWIIYKRHSWTKMTTNRNKLHRYYSFIGLSNIEDGYILNATPLPILCSFFFAFPTAPEITFS